MTTAAPSPDLLAESERLFLLDLLRDGIAGLTSAPPPYDRKPFRDGGRWRGDIPKALERRGIIAAVSAKAGPVAATAQRPARHRGFVLLWKLLDRRAAEVRLAELTARRTRPARTLFDGLDD